MQVEWVWFLLGLHLGHSLLLGCGYSSPREVGLPLPAAPGGPQGARLQPSHNQHHREDVQAAAGTDAVKICYCEKAMYRIHKPGGGRGSG